MIHLNVEGMLAVDSTNDFIQSDYFTDLSQISKLTSNTSNWRFFVNALIDTKYYKKVLKLSRSYPILANRTFGIYKFKTNFENSAISKIRSYKITQSIFLNY